MKDIILKFGLLISAILILFQLSQYTLLTQGLSNQLWIVGLGVSFIGIGIIISRLIFKPNPIQNVESTPPLPQTTEEAIPKPSIQETLQSLEISKREFEVLQKIAEGLSNKEIAATLFISESTVKTHVSKILSKMDVKRRTQAVAKAKSLKLLS